MRISASTLPALLALAASTTSATPLSYTNNALAARTADTFNIHVWNNCKFVKEVAIYSVTANFKMVRHTARHNLWPGQSVTLAAPYKDVGMRLSGHAEWGTDGQWRPQALFEFGYSTYQSVEGTLAPAKAKFAGPGGVQGTRGG
ncbi:hypothetical protein LTR53_002593 [Teratosphaeriaceae sp. CCFEE 6253]|nr:hypothetical protein LTR53_002593 [Teratosphaeriaceae sp. CCFEE 6253]